MAQTTWDPAQYLRHAGHRTRPFVDLLAQIPGLPEEPARIADLGCGPGTVTALLADRWPTAAIHGFDNSPEMLADAQKLARPGSSEHSGSLTFHHADLANWAPGQRYDLIVSNAALQWIPEHTALIPAWINALTPGGTFALQVPGQFTAPSHQLLYGLCESPRWRERLSGEADRHASVLTAPGYLELLAGLGCEVNAWETTYAQLLPGQDAVLDWTKGTTLRSVLAALAGNPADRDAFLAEYRDLLREAYPAGPHGTVYPFRRIFAIATVTKA
ncbi:MAG TPA: trans-aconitate 2-methyltransferase [Actinocrinis sp.]|nr:trans-aconitate 2-methyltransferase [Actinocrinis sp.]